MNPTTSHEFDKRVQQLHETALSHISPQTLAKLRASRQSATQALDSRSRDRRVIWPWALGSSFAFALALAAGFHFMTPPPPSETQWAVVQDVSLEALDVAVADYEATTLWEDDPGFYAWLGSKDPALL